MIYCSEKCRRNKSIQWSKGDFGTWVGLILVFSVMSLGILKLGGIILFQRIKRSILKKFSQNEGINSVIEILLGNIWEKS